MKTQYSLPNIYRIREFIKTSKNISVEFISDKGLKTMKMKTFFSFYSRNELLPYCI
jgi:hypothetical protein